MGNLSTLIYVVLMVTAYGSQVHHIWKTKSTAGLSHRFFVLTATAVALRMVTTGFIIRETDNLTAWLLEIAEFAVLGGLITISFQVWYYRRGKTRR